MHLVPVRVPSYVQVSQVDFFVDLSNGSLVMDSLDVVHLVNAYHFRNSDDSKPVLVELVQMVVQDVALSRSNFGFEVSFLVFLVA